jgi:hypothetical protein
MTMTLYPKPTSLLLGAALIAMLGCIHKPVFDYEIEPGAPVTQFATVALDPRELVWQVEGQRPIDPWEYRAAVVKELRQRGYRFVKAGEADLWLDIIAVSPAGGRPDQAVAQLLPNGGQASARNQRGIGRQADGTAMGVPGAGSSVGAEAAAYNARPTEVTTIVKLVSRADEKTLWTGTVVIPAYRPGSGPQVPPAEWIHRLLVPLPPCAKNQASVQQ